MDGVLAFARAAVLLRMRATCVIEKSTITRNPATGLDETTWTTVYPDPSWGADHEYKAGPCYTRYPGLAHETHRVSGGSTVTETKLVLRIPHAVKIEPGQRVRILSDPDNELMVGEKFLVASIDDMSQSSAMRVLCDDYQAGVSK